jgi:Na+/H+ antiporter NhaA
MKTMYPKIVAIILIAFCIPSNAEQSVESRLSQAEQSVSRSNVAEVVGPVLVFVAVALCIKSCLSKDEPALIIGGLAMWLSSTMISKQREFKKCEGVFQLGVQLAVKQSNAEKEQILKYFTQHDRVCSHGCKHTPKRIAIQRDALQQGWTHPNATDNERHEMVLKILQNHGM